MLRSRGMGLAQRADRLERMLASPYAAAEVAIASLAAHATGAEHYITSALGLSLSRALSAYQQLVVQPLEQPRRLRCRQPSLSLTPSFSTLLRTLQQPQPWCSRTASAPLSA